MPNFIFKPEYIRLFVFLLGLVIFSILEYFLSYRPRSLKRFERWPANTLMTLISNVLIKLIFPTGLIFFALYAKEHSLGFFNHYSIHQGLELVLSIIILDLAIYIQHVLSHKIPIFWRFHKVHHADIDLDATSALRFHPVEILASLLYKSMFVVILGISVTAIIVFEIILNFLAMFNHANLYIPKKFEGILRYLLVTPQMHIVHHSVNHEEANKNFGFNLSIWDRLFKTYQAQFKNDSTIGLSYFRKSSEHSLIKILLLPFKKIQ
ncbi:sterol desaturase family protein [bacterium]|nr:sterol desaturase family protein [bacterium]